MKSLTRTGRETLGTTNSGSPTPYGQKNETIRGRSKIDDQHEEQEVGSTAGLRDRLGEPGASAAE